MRTPPYPGVVASTTTPGERTAVPARPAGVGTVVLSYVAPAIAVAVAVALALSALSGAEGFARLGLPDPGAVVVNGLPVARAIAQSSAVATIGSLLLVAFLVPPDTGSWLSRDGYRAMRVAAWTSATWAVAAMVMVPLSVADAYGRPLGSVLDPRILMTSVTGISASGAWTLTAVIALLVGALVRVVLSWGATVPVLALAVAGLTPVALTGHSATGGSHDVATNSLLFHVVAAAIWVGGLLVLVVHLGCGGGHAPTAARRFSRVALVCWIVMAVSGVVNALVRLPPDELFTSTYGLLVVLKGLGLLALGAFGAWHRNRSLPAVAAGSTAGLVRFGGVEVLVMFATLGVAVALGRTAPPADAIGEPGRVEALIGYPLDGPLTVSGVLTDARFDLVFGTAALVLAGLYLRGVRRLRHRGDAWPVGRTVAWMLGCLTLLVATSSGIGRYAPAQFSVHMGQHMLLNMLVPILLVLGTPTTLALRALPVAGRGAPPGPREWVLAAVHSPVARVLTHPAVTLTLFVGSFYVLYFSGLFDSALQSHWAHLLMNLHFLLVGYLFFWPIVGVDPSPRPLPPLARLGLLLAAVPLHAIFGLAVMSADTVIGAQFYDELALPWVDRLADQSAGGGLAWASGELPMLVVLIAVLVQWSRQDERLARSSDRRAERDGDRELVAYNAMLRNLARTGRPGGGAEGGPDGRTGWDGDGDASGQAGGAGDEHDSEAPRPSVEGTTTRPTDRI